MYTSEIINILNTKNNGAYFKIQYATDARISASAKKAGHSVVKITTATARKGITYKNLGAVQRRLEEKVANGEMTKEEALNYKPHLSWGQWKKGFENLLLEHKGNDYLRLYTSPNKSKVRWMVDGVEMTKDEVKATGFVLDSYWKEKDTKDRDCYDVKVANIQAIY